MVFSSPAFLFLFLPFALLVCLSLRHRPYLFALLTVSLLFYAWSAGPHTIVLVGLILGNFVAAKYVARSASRLLFVPIVLANLAVLFWFKYARFFAVNLDGWLHSNLASVVGEVALPAGVSFFVFQAISYLSDVRRKDITPEPSLVTYGAYQAFFPHLIAGPIVRYRDVVDDLRGPRWTAESVGEGVSRFSHGLAKKVVVADGVAPIANAAFALDPSELTMPTAWLGAIAYSLQIYFDFSGYSDMALGLARVFGVRFHENFQRPYSSRSLTEFWRRWHISLSTWFRDYLYIPLGGSRGGSLATYRNLLIVFAVTGFWHGAAWTFVAWGLFHGLFLVAERLAFDDPTRALRSMVLRYFYCLPVVIFGWVLFRAPTIHCTFRFWKEMLGMGTVSSASMSELPRALQIELTPYACAALVVGMLIFFAPGSSSLGSQLFAQPVTRAGRVANLGYTVGALTLSALLVSAGGFSPFLYFNF